MKKIKYLFILQYYRNIQGRKQTITEEYVIAETWDQAREYWKSEFSDEGVEVIKMEKSVPVLAILPLETR